MQMMDNNKKEIEEEHNLPQCNIMQLNHIMIITMDQEHYNQTMHCLEVMIDQIILILCYRSINNKFIWSRWDRTKNKCRKICILIEEGTIYNKRWIIRVLKNNWIINGPQKGFSQNLIMLLVKKDSNFRKYQKFNNLYKIVTVEKLMKPSIDLDLIINLDNRQL